MTSPGDRFSKSHKLPQKPQAAEGKGDFWGSSGWQWPLSLSQGGLGDQDLAGQVLQVRRLRRVQLDVVLGQDFEDGPQPQPPLLLGDAVLEIRLLAQLGDGLEHQAALAHPQQARRVCRVGKDPPWQEHGTFGNLLGASWEYLGSSRDMGEGWEYLGIFRDGRAPGREFGSVWDPPGAGVGNVWDAPGGEKPVGG